MKPILLLTMLLAFLNFAKAQVKTDFNNPYIIPARDIKALLEKETLDNISGASKPFKIAESIKQFWKWRCK